MKKVSGKKAGMTALERFQRGFRNLRGTDEDQSTGNHQRTGRKKKIVRAASVLACVVAFTTTYALILPAVTLESQPVCGQEEHIHTEACYAYLDADGAVVDPAEAAALLAAGDSGTDAEGTETTLFFGSRGGYSEGGESNVKTEMDADGITEDGWTTDHTGDGSADVTGEAGVETAEYSLSDPAAENIVADQTADLSGMDRFTNALALMNQNISIDAADGTGDRNETKTDAADDAGEVGTDAMDAGATDAANADPAANAVTDPATAPMLDAGIDTSNRENPDATGNPVTDSAAPTENTGVDASGSDSPDTAGSRMSAPVIAPTENADTGTSDNENPGTADTPASDATADDPEAGAADPENETTTDPASDTAQSVRRVLICGQEEHQHSVECYPSKSESSSSGSAKNISPKSILTGLVGYDHSQSVTVDGTTITAEYNDGILPDDVTMQAVPVSADAYVGAVADAVGRENTEIKTFDITFLSGDQEIEPSGEVKITFQADFIDPDTDPAIVHITDDGSADLLDAKISDDTITLKTDSFSVYAISYTVDFHYEVDGKTYDFSMPGGGFVSLTDLVEVLGIAGSDENGGSVGTLSVENSENGAEIASENDDSAGSDVNDENDSASETVIKRNEAQVSEAAKKFVADVESVEFSDSGLVDVSKVEETTTVGSIKDARGLGVEYSADLTEEQIAEINNSTVEAGDWVLISVRAFVNAEKLTITMKSGYSFDIRVTDAQISQTSDITSDSEGEEFVIYTISNNAYYALYQDGTSKTIASEKDLNDLGDEYLWAVVKHSNNQYTIKNKANDRYLVLDQNLRVVTTTVENEVIIDAWDGDNKGGFNIYRSVPIMGTEEYIDYEWTFTGLIPVLRPVIKTREVVTGYHYYRLAWDSSSGFKVNYDQSGNRMRLWKQTEVVETGGENQNVPGINVDINDTQQWFDYILSKNMPLDESNVLKTAEVYDYENRVYRVDMTAKSSLATFDGMIDLGFILDVSSSMQFPSKLKKTGLQLTRSQIQNGTSNGLDTSKVYYVIADPENTATVYRIHYNGNARAWYRVDGSLNDGSTGDVPISNYSSTGNCFGPDTRNESKKYDIYISDDNNPDGSIISREYYENQSMSKALSTLISIMQKIKIASSLQDNPSVKIAWNTFAGRSTRTDKTNGHDYEAIRNSNTTFTPVENGITLTYDYFGGTRTDIALAGTSQSADHFNWESSATKYAILITDGAPLESMSDTVNGKSLRNTLVPEAANKLKAGSDGRLNTSDDVKLITVGLSMNDVINGSTLLKNIASKRKDGTPLFYNAESGDELQYILLQIVRDIMTEAITVGDVTDTIDPAFYPVDHATGQPLLPADGTSYYIDLTGNVIRDASTGLPVIMKPSGVECGKLERSGDTYKVTWTDQDISWDGWHGSIFIKAKEDLLGGNSMPTNKGDASINAKAYKIDEDSSPISLKSNINNNNNQYTMPTPHVNVDELAFTQNSTEWTVYKGTTIDPETQLKTLLSNIMVRQVVTDPESGTPSERIQTAGSEGQFTYQLLANSPSDDRAFKPGTTAASFRLSEIVSLTDEEWTEIIKEIDKEDVNISDIITKDYLYNGVKVGEFTIQVSKVYSNEAIPAHEANDIGNPRVMYDIVVTYEPDPVKNVEYHTGGYATSDAGKATEDIRSENIHRINVFQKSIKITKVDKSDPDKTLEDATFALYRVDPDGTADVSAYNLPSGKYTLVSDTLTVNSSGVVTIDPVIPDVAEVPRKTLYEPNISVGASTDKSHGTVFYLVEKKAPKDGDIQYARMPGAIKITMTLTEDKGNDSSVVLYNWTQTASISAEEYGNGTDSYLINDGTDPDDEDLYLYKIKNGRSTDITLIKVDKKTKNSIGGAKFKLLKGSENVDLTHLTITAINEGTAVTPEDYDLNGTTIKVVTVPEGGIRIAGLVDDTYTLQEVVAPAGYVITDSGKTFKTVNGAVKNADNSAHTNEATGIAFEVGNEPGVALPNTGGSGTRLFTILGCILFFGAGMLLWMRRRMV